MGSGDLPDEMGQVITKCVRPPAPLKGVQEKGINYELWIMKLQNRKKLQTIKLQDFLQFMCIDEYTDDAFQEKY